MAERTRRRRVVAVAGGGGRYRLVGARACPWANRVIITRRLLGLEGAISLGIAGPLHDERSWRFHLDPGNVDPVLGIEYLREAYEKAVPGYAEGASPSPRWSRWPRARSSPTNTRCWSGTCPPSGGSSTATAHTDLWTDPEAIEQIGKGIFHDVNNGVYKCGFASSQRAYDRAYDALWSRMDELSDHLSTRRYLVGDSITQADIRLWVTLVRFDAAYHGHFKANRHKLTELPVLWAYARDLFPPPGFGDTIDFEQVKQHYYGVHASVNPTGIVPKGPDLALDDPTRPRGAGGRPFGDGTPPGPPPESERVPAIG